MLAQQLNIAVPVRTLLVPNLKSAGARGYVNLLFATAAHPCGADCDGGPTNRWTGATGSDFRIKRGPAKLLDSAVARSTPPLGVFSNTHENVYILLVAFGVGSRLLLRARTNAPA